MVINVGRQVIFGKLCCRFRPFNYSIVTIISVLLIGESFQRYSVRLEYYSRKKFPDNS